MGYLPFEKIAEMGFAALGNNVSISDKCSIYNPSKIFLGNNIRIDDYAIISAGKAGIYIEDNVHIACYVSLIGAEKISIGAFSGISARTSVYSSNDDYSGNALTGPTVDNHFRNVNNAPVHIGKHVIIGASSVILPGCIIKDGVAIGSMSLVNKNCEKLGIYVGVPVKWVKQRSALLFELENSYLKWMSEQKK